jgi:hypothetical protein
MFFNAEKPIMTCQADSCDGCAVNHAIHCHFTWKDLVHFLLISLPPFLLGGVGIYKQSVWLLVFWILIVIAFFGFIEIRVMCSHCPHYAEPGTSLKCWANYGAPKLWKYRPGPMSIIEKIVFFSGFVIVWGYPLVVLVVSGQWFLLLVYGMTTAAFFMTLTNFLCVQCMNFACPLNRVEEDRRIKFFKQNPIVGKAWGKASSAESRTRSESVP